MTHSEELIEKYYISLTQGREIKELVTKIQNCITYHKAKYEELRDKTGNTSVPKAEEHWAIAFAQRDILRQLEDILNS